MPKTFLLLTSPYSPTILDVLIFAKPRWYSVFSTGVQQGDEWEYYLVGEGEK